jgi:hypothetical protein
MYEYLGSNELPLQPSFSEYWLTDSDKQFSLHSIQVVAPWTWQTCFHYIVFIIQKEFQGNFTEWSNSYFLNRPKITEFKL